MGQPKSWMGGLVETVGLKSKGMGRQVFLKAMGTLAFLMGSQPEDGSSQPPLLSPLNRLKFSRMIFQDFFSSLKVRFFCPMLLSPSER